MAKGISVFLYTPESKESQQKLERQLAGVYAENIRAALNQLDCEPEQKQGVLKSVIEAIAANKRDKKDS